VSRPKNKRRVVDLVTVDDVASPPRGRHLWFDVGCDRFRVPEQRVRPDCIDLFPGARWIGRVGICAYPLPRGNARARARYPIPGTVLPTSRSSAINKGYSPQAASEMRPRRYRVSAVLFCRVSVTRHSARAISAFPHQGQMHDHRVRTESPTCTFQCPNSGGHVRVAKLRTSVPRDVGILAIQNRNPPMVMAWT